MTKSLMDAENHVSQQTNQELVPGEVVGLDHCGQWAGSRVAMLYAIPYA